jgi:predicted DNA-binding transcriptional regulator YafY
MSDPERLHRIKYMIQQRKCVPIEAFLDELEISKATFKRDLEYLRSRSKADIEYDRFLGGYKFKDGTDINKIELTGIWFSEKEATALVLMQHLLSSLDQGGLIGPHIEPLTSIIDGILGQSETTTKELRKRIKVLGMGSRKNSMENFGQRKNSAASPARPLARIACAHNRPHRDSSRPTRARALACYLLTPP